MRWGFNQKLRESLAKELKRAAWVGSGSTLVWGLFDSTWAVVAASAVVWTVLQSAAHLLLAMEDDDP